MKYVKLTTPPGLGPCPVCGKQPVLDYGEDDEWVKGKKTATERRYSLFCLGDRHFVGLTKGRDEDEVIRAWIRAFGTGTDRQRQPTTDGGSTPSQEPTQQTLI